MSLFWGRLYDTQRWRLRRNLSPTSTDNAFEELLVHTHSGCEVERLTLQQFAFVAFGAS